MEYCDQMQLLQVFPETLATLVLVTLLVKFQKEHHIDVQKAQSLE